MKGSGEVKLSDTAWCLVVHPDRQDLTYHHAAEH